MVSCRTAEGSAAPGAASPGGAMSRDRVLIPGGACGIGRATAERCCAEGYEVAVIDRDGDGIRADLSDPAQTARALEAALSRGPITRLVNNVGVVRPGSLEEQTFADLDAVVSLNLRCALQCVQALLPGMKAARFGRIVNISSRAALGKEHRTVYAATKAGLTAWRRCGPWNSASTASPRTRSAPAR